MLNVILKSSNSLTWIFLTLIIQISYILLLLKISWVLYYQMIYEELYIIENCCSSSSSLLVDSFTKKIWEVIIPTMKIEWCPPLSIFPTNVTICSHSNSAILIDTFEHKNYVLSFHIFERCRNLSILFIWINPVFQQTKPILN